MRMRIRFEEQTAAQRAGGIEGALQGLVLGLSEVGIEVVRSSQVPEADPLALPDVVHVHGLWSPSLASRLLSWKKRGVPCVVSPHGMLEPWALAHKRWKKFPAWYLYQKRVLNQAAAIHGTSEKEKQQFTRLGLKTPSEVIPWGVAIPENTKPTRPAETNDSLRALFVGRIYPVKGLLMLVEAWARVRPVGWVMKLVGPDEAGHRAEVEALVQKHDLQDKFQFLGELVENDKSKAYASSDLLILPSFSENFGLVVAEAMAHGLPVLTTHGTPWEEVKAKGCGWWVPTSVEGIAEGLRIACSHDRRILNKMGNRGREWVAKDFIWKEVATKMCALYNKLLK